MIQSSSYHVESDHLPWAHRRRLGWSVARVSERPRSRKPSPTPAERVRAALDSAGWLLRLEDGWDGAEAPKPSAEAFRRAERFLLATAEWLHRNHDVYLEAPDIGPGPAGGVDLHWRLPRFELLVNVPADEAQPLEFYGDDRGKVAIKGIVAQEEGGGPLSLWLASGLR